MPNFKRRQRAYSTGLETTMIQDSLDRAGVGWGKGRGRENVGVTGKHIELRGVEVHNLKQVDLDIPLRKLVVFCGVSGSGKTSLALDTLYAEGQRRYIESFSVYTRQFLERLEKPAAERIDGIPAAIAVTHQNPSRSSRSTIGTATEIVDYLRLLYSKVAQLFCRQCGNPVLRESSQTIAEKLNRLPSGTRYMIGFAPKDIAAPVGEVATLLKEQGFTRVAVFASSTPPSGSAAVGRTVNTATDEVPAGTTTGDILVIVDRLAAGGPSDQRLRDSLETALEQGAGRCFVLVERPPIAAESTVDLGWLAAGAEASVDDRTYDRVGFASQLRCLRCDLEYAEPEPRRFSFNSPLGACPTCEGFGNLMDWDMELIVPDPAKSIRHGAIAPWNSPSYAHELQELLALAGSYDLPVDVPFSELTPEQVRLIREGVPERSFGGLNGFFAWLEKRKYKMHLRVFTSRWRSARVCPTCNGNRLNEEALAWKIDGQNIADVTKLRIDRALVFFRELPLTDHQRRIARVMLDQVVSRLGFLHAVGLGYLEVDRTLRTLSGGEAQRVALTSALGSSLVNMLYVLDEPSVGLHPRDVTQLVEAIERLRDRGNTVVVVEHEEGMIRAADWLVEIGPGAGDGGGRITFQGNFPEMLVAGASLTGDFLAGRRGISLPQARRPISRGYVKLIGARGNNLKNLTVEFPLGLMCVVSGVSGAGKSTLVQDTLYGAICRRKRKDCDKPLPYDDVVGDGQVDDVVLVDQTPIGRSPRSNPVTYIKAFDPIRAVFAETVEARTHNYGPGHFSFNIEGGRCDACQGEGYVQIDMQFMPDLFMKCGTCGGARYRREILSVQYRGRNIAEVLEMTVREAFAFFRGQPKVQGKLKQLIDVGLDYLQLGQPANTLSGGEAQRLKLAAHLSEATRSRTLFLLDEPTTGLHFSDVVQLLDCFDALLGIGHSLIIVEHNLQLMRAADYIIDMGPGAGSEGGQIIARGTPEEIAADPNSMTGKYLAPLLVRLPEEQTA
jgi:excinuclease ABC subunit A